MKVNGPVNVVRLEGKIGNTPKVIYLFFDLHKPIEKQSKCDNNTKEEILNIDEYILKNIDTKITYDYVFERNPLASLGNKIYIEKMNVLYEKFHKKDNIKNKITNHTNIRSHWVDIRRYLFPEYYSSSDLILNKIVNSKSIDIKNNLKYYILSYIGAASLSHRSLKHLGYVLFNYKDFKKQNINIPNPELNDSIKNMKDYDSLLYLKTIVIIVDKLKNKYTNESVKKIINEHLLNLDELLRQILDVIDAYIDKLYDMYLQLLKQQDTFIVKKTIDLIIEIDDYIYSKLFITFGLYLMDLYCMRRILDKNYITNALVYTGGLHSSNYIRILLRDFDFKITHVSNMPLNKTMSVEELNIIIKKTTMTDLEISKLFFNMDSLQCSDLSSFPIQFK